MSDTREAILARLLEIAAAVPGITTAVRNEPQVSAKNRPAIAIFDGDELVEDIENLLNRPSQAPVIVRLVPEIYIALADSAEDVGAALNGFRTAFVKAVTGDATLGGYCQRIRYLGCETGLTAARQVEAQMSVGLAFVYVLYPTKL